MPSWGSRLGPEVLRKMPWDLSVFIFFPEHGKALSRISPVNSRSRARLLDVSLLIEACVKPFTLPGLPVFTASLLCPPSVSWELTWCCYLSSTPNSSHSCWHLCSELVVPLGPTLTPSHMWWWPLRETLRWIKPFTVMAQWERGYHFLIGAPPNHD